MLAEPSLADMAGIQSAPGYRSWHLAAEGMSLRLDDLKDHYGMGASPLREALSRLVGEGLVQLENNRGFRVAGLSGRI